MYQIVLSRNAEKDLNKVDDKFKPHIFAALFDLRKNPQSGKKLKGKFQDYYSLRVGIYRIIYKIYKKELNILVIRIGHRQGVYK
jgi:mRNA interferase RelE/StbE